MIYWTPRGSTDKARGDCTERKVYPEKSAAVRVFISATAIPRTLKAAQRRAGRAILGPLPFM